jgi:hypothetical protein
MECVINSVRAEYGLPALVDSLALDHNAQSHSVTSAPLGSQWGISDVLADANGDATAYAAVSRWMATPRDPSCTLILGPVTDVGVGILDHALLGPRVRGGNKTVHVRAKTKHGIIVNVPFAHATLKRMREQKSPTVELSVLLTRPARPTVLFEEPLGA